MNHTALLRRWLQFAAGDRDDLDALIVDTQRAVAEPLAALPSAESHATIARHFGIRPSRDSVYRRDT